MKRNLWASGYLPTILLIILSFGLCPQSASATSPKSVDLAYDAGEGTLSVKVDHYTAFKGMHHVQFVEIKKNGSSIGKHEYENQPSDDVFTYTYKIAAAKSDVLEVTASCNLWGRKTTTLTVP